MKPNYIIFLVIILAGCLGSIASDIYAPSLSSISREFATKIDNVQWSMAIFMLGIAVSQIFYGPISEGIGRKPPLLFGLAIALIGTYFCWSAPDITWLITGRFIQGFGAGAGSALWRSIFRDSYTGTDLSKYGSYLAVLVTLLVPAAPVVGGYLEQYYGWRSIFTFMGFVIIVTILFIVFFYKETNQHRNTNKLRLLFILNTFYFIIRNRAFIGYAFGTFLCYGAVFSWFTAGPVLLIDHVGITPSQFGLISFFAGGSSMVGASLTNGFLVKRVGTQFMLKLGWSIMTIAGLLMLAGYYVIGVNIYALVIPMMLFFFGSTFIFPNAFASAFQNLGEIAGYAGSTYTFIQISGAAFWSGVISYLPDYNQVPLAFVFITSPILAWLIYEKRIKPLASIPNK